jgi:signal transduction histidine kinase
MEHERPDEPHGAAEVDIDAFARAPVTDDLRHDIRATAGTIVRLANVLQSEQPSELRSSRTLAAIIGCAQTIAALATEPRSEQRSAVRVDHVAGVAAEQAQFGFDGTVIVHAAPALVRASELELTRLFDNVLTNACRAAGPGGAVHVDVVVEHDLVVIEVRDSGPGFGGEGPLDGIGLTIIRTLTTELGGHVHITGAPPNRSTTVRIELPRDEDLTEEPRMTSEGTSP